MKNFKIILIILGFIILLDQFLFGFVLWKLPNESPWGTNHFFNFVYELKQVEDTPKKNKRILVIGSSITYYSIDKNILKSQIRKKMGTEIEVEYLSYAGMTPLDAFLLRDKIANLKPDLILYPVNFIDFRLHRAYVLHPEKTNENSDDTELILDALNFGDAPQSKFAFPFETLKEFAWKLPMNRTANFLAASLFLFYRYREIYLPNLKNLWNHRFGRNTSYHGYGGIQVPERINSLGWTGKSFSFETKKYMYEDGFFIQVVPEIIKNSPLELKIFSIETSDRDSNGNSGGIEMNSPVASREQNKVASESPKLETKKIELQKEIFNSMGWKKIILNKKIPIGSFVKIELSQTWKPSQAIEDRQDYSDDEVGVRLQQIFGLDKPIANQQYFREERSEDLRYENMSDMDYRKYFEYRLLSNVENRPGIRYIWALKNAKERLTTEKFRPTIHFQYLQKFAKDMNDKKIPMLILNNPENPIALEWYGKSNWYISQLEFLKSLENENVKFIDLKDSLPMQNFSDFHHLTFRGMERMNFEILKLVEKFLLYSNNKK